MLSYVAPNFIMLKNILASFNITHLSPLFHSSTKVKERDILHIYNPTFVSSLFKERGMKLLIYFAKHYLLIVCEQDLLIHLLESVLKRNCKDNYHFQLSLGPSILLYNPQLV